MLNIALKGRQVGLQLPDAQCLEAQNTQKRDSKRSTRHVNLMTLTVAARLCAAWKYGNDTQ